MMAFSIISGRNQGYPCISELRERSSAVLVQPICEFMFDLSGGGYPVIAPVRKASAELVSPIPEYIMVCLGDRVNSGLPWITVLKALRSVMESSLYFRGRQVQAMYFNENPCKTAYCNGKKVFAEYLIREKIV